MILSKDNDTLNLTASILSAKSMLQSKLDGIGIDVRNIENALNALQNEIVQLKVEVEETKEELTTTAEELKATTDNDKIKHLIDEVETTLDEIEINDDILDGLCLSDFISDPVCGAECHGQHGETSSGSGTSCDCYGYSEDDGWDCYMEWDNLCTSCFKNGFDETCGLDYVNCGGNGYCHSGFSANGETCPTEFKNDCENGYIMSVDDGISCTLRYISGGGTNCELQFEEDGVKTSCTGRFEDDGLNCVDYYDQTEDTTICINDYQDPDTGASCDGYSIHSDGGVECFSDFDKGDGTTCADGYSVDSNGIVSCESGHSGDDGSCEGGHTWKDDIGGSCEGIFHNSTMNCQGGVAQDKTEERLTCNSIYTSGNINCSGGYGEDIDDQVVFCPSSFSDGHTTCRSGYMKQNGTETCTNKDPISCRGGCVSGYCDYCGGCVSNCDSCRGCHGEGNCNHTECEQCHGTTVTFPCGAPSCGGFYDNCVANNWGHHEYD